MQHSFVVPIRKLLAMLSGQACYAGEKLSLCVLQQVWADLEVYQRIAPEFEIYVDQLFYLSLIIIIDINLNWSLASEHLVQNGVRIRDNHILLDRNLSIHSWHPRILRGRDG